MTYSQRFSEQATLSAMSTSLQDSWEVANSHKPTNDKGG